MKYTDAQLQEIARTVKANGGSIAKAAMLLATPVRTIENQMKAFKVRGLVLPTERDPLEAAKLEIKTLKRDLNEVIKENMDAQSIKKEIYGLSQIEPEAPEWILDQKKVGRKARAGIPMLHWSDWHYGEVVSLAETGGANEFNRDIARQRVRALVESSIRLARGFAFREDHSAPPGIVVAINGDLISGDIHDELRETNEAPPFVCVDDLFGMLVWSIDQLKDQFGKVFVPCTVGNHGRSTLKPRSKNRVFLSYEWNLYRSLQRHYQNDPKVSVLVADGADLLYKVNGWRVFQTHGDALGVKGGDGIIGALGPIARGAIKIRDSEVKIGKDFDYLIMGHWHQDLWIGNTVVNGALIGYNGFARLVLRARPARPSQQIWFMHPEHGMTARLPVYVDKAEPKRLGVEPKWVEVLQ